MTKIAFFGVCLVCVMSSNYVLAAQDETAVEKYEKGSSLTFGSVAERILGGMKKFSPADSVENRRIKYERAAASLDLMDWFMILVYFLMQNMLWDGLKTFYQFMRAPKPPPVNPEMVPEIPIPAYVLPNAPPPEGIKRPLFRMLPARDLLCGLKMLHYSGTYKTSQTGHLRENCEQRVLTHHHRICTPCLDWYAEQIQRQANTLCEDAMNVERWNLAQNV